MQSQSSTQQMSSQLTSQLTSRLTGICIVALPREYRTSAEVKHLMENILQIGQVSSVHLAETMAKTGIVYSTANVVMASITSVTLQRELDQGEGRASVELPDGLSMTWENGKPMAHLSIRQLDISRFEFCSPAKKLELAEDSWTSVHIPILPKNLTRFNPATRMLNAQPAEGFYDTVSGLTDLFQNKLGLGQVSRVDLVTRDDKEGNPKAAFIHFAHWYDNKNARFVREKLDESGNFRQRGFYDGFNMQRFMVQNGQEQQDAYFNIKINHRPIPEVDEATCELNIHQLVAANKRLQEQVAEQELRIAEQEKMLAEQDTKINELSQIVGQLGQPHILHLTEKDMLGERIYHIVEVRYPELAGKITGMLLELDAPDLYELLESADLMNDKIDEAIIVLKHSWASDESPSESKHSVYDVEEN